MSIALNASPPAYLAGAELPSHSIARSAQDRPAVTRLGSPQGHAVDGGAAVPLDTLLLDAVQQAGANAQDRYAGLQTLVTLPTPELIEEGEDEMISLQSRLGDFGIALSLQSALARKGVNAIETLIKS
jgi:hypothetical protein